MTKIFTPPKQKMKYNQKLTGYFGEFGNGADSKIYYLLTGIKPPQLDKLTLLSDIPGSEKWSIRDLFQRDVNIDRVSNQIIPYLEDKNKVKFFNPLTLTPFPINEQGQTIDYLDQLKEYDFEDENGKWDCIELENFYRYNILVENNYCEFEWHDDTIKIVAIDGQHRLSAMKRHKDDTTQNSKTSQEFLKWTIPVVIFGLKSTDAKDKSHTTKILNAVRNVFIYINKEAVSPTDTRKILLNDESVNSLCAQEIVELAHDNETKGRGFDDGILPLMFFGWRDETKKEANTEQRKKPYIVTVTEIHDWLKEYILAEDFKDDQKKNMMIQPVDTLNIIYTDKQIPNNLIHHVRNYLKNDIVKSIHYLLRSFEPYDNYINGLRKLERIKYEKDKSDFINYAFYQLRYGVHRGSDEIRQNIADSLNEIQIEIEKLKSTSLNGLLEKDVVIRGIIYAFGTFKKYYEKSIKKSSNWYDYSKWFSTILNKIYKDEWFKKNSNKFKHLKNIIYDSNDIIINYRLESAKNALGALLMILIAKYSVDLKTEIKEEIISINLETISDTVYKGYKRYCRSILKRELPEGDELNKRTEANAKKETKDQIKALSKTLKLT